MAKTSYVNISSGLEELFFAGVRVGDRFQFAKLVKKTAPYSVRKKEILSARSLLPAISVLWGGFSPVEKEAWAAAADAEIEINNSFDFIVDNATYGIATFGIAKYGKYIPLSNLSGWRLFVQDQSVRIKSGLSGVATPSLFHQVWIGNLKIEAPASELKIVQEHPHFYWISRKVTGKKTMCEPVLISEDLSLDFKIFLNYRAELVASGPTPSAKFYVRFWHSSQGVDLYSDFVVTLDLDTTADANNGWKKAEATISLFGVGPFGDTVFAAESELLGYYIRYDLFIHLEDLTGDLFVDNVGIVHSSQNWARDKYCSNINQNFSKGFYQISKHWKSVVLPSGASYKSIYKDF